MQAFSALPYQFPRSIATMVEGATMWLVLGAAFLAASLLGSEFSWGTIRNVALFRPDRLRYLGARLAWIVGLVLVTFVVVVALGAVAPAVVRVDPGNPAALTQDLSGMGGLPPGPTGPVSLGGALLVAASFFCLALAGIALAGLAALKFRSTASGILGAGIYAIVEGIAASLWMSRATGDLGYVPQLALTVRLTAFLGDAQVAAGLNTGNGGQSSSPGWVALPPLVGAAILAVWLFGLFGLWFVVLRRADIDE
jgi:ABC-type transport system involved in multi-copper enzyme maturation permease subunit